MKSVHELVAEARTHIDNLSPTQVRDEVASGKAILIDVREPLEWEEHIEGAFQVPRGLLEYAVDPESQPRLPQNQRVEVDPSRRVITYCRSGARSALAAYTLKTIGLEHVASLDGGITAWKKANLPTVEHHGGV